MENGREEYNVQVFEKRMLRKMHRPRRENVNRNWENCTVSSFVNYFSPYQILFGCSSKGK